MDNLERAWEFAHRELRGGMKGRGTVRQGRTKWFRYAVASEGPFRVTSAASLGERPGKPEWTNSNVPGNSRGENCAAA